MPDLESQGLAKDLVLVRKMAHRGLGFMPMCIWVGLVVMTVLKEATNNGQAFIGDLTAAIEDDQSFCEEYMFLGTFALRCAVSGEVMTFKTDSQQQDIHSEVFGLFC